MILLPPRKAWDLGPLRASEALMAARLCLLVRGARIQKSADFGFAETALAAGREDSVYAPIPVPAAHRPGINTQERADLCRCEEPVGGGFRGGGGHR